MEDLKNSSNSNGVSDKNGIGTVDSNGSASGGDWRARAKVPETEFLIELRESQVRQAKAALVNTIARRGRHHMIGTILDELERDDANMYEMFRMLTLEEIFQEFGSHGDGLIQRRRNELAPGTREEDDQEITAEETQDERSGRSPEKSESESARGDKEHGGEDFELLDSDEFVEEDLAVKPDDLVWANSLPSITGDESPVAEYSHTFIARFHQEFPDMPEDTSESRLHVLWSMILKPDLDQYLPASAISESISFHKDTVKDALCWGVENGFIDRAGKARGTKYRVPKDIINRLLTDGVKGEEPNSDLAQRPKKKKKKGKKGKSKLRS